RRPDPRAPGPGGEQRRGAADRRCCGDRVPAGVAGHGAGALGGEHAGTARVRTRAGARGGTEPCPDGAGKAPLAGRPVRAGREPRGGGAGRGAAAVTGTPLAGQTALVTGGSRGIGRAIASRLAALGAGLVVNYVANEAAAAETVRAIVERGGRARALRFDVGDAAAVRAAFDDVVDREGRVDILVNNAGLAIDGLLLRLKDDDWNRVLQTNLTGVFHCARAAVRSM